MNSKWIWVLGLVLLVLMVLCHWLLTLPTAPVHITIPKEGTAQWNVSQLRVPIYRGKLVCEIFADEAHSVSGKAVELDNPIIFYYGPDMVTKITGQKGTGELVDGELKNLRVWGKTHVERRARANPNVERLRGDEDPSK